MSKVQVDTIVDKDDISAPTLSKGAIVTGVCTATTFVGAVTGDVTGNVTGNADTATTATTATSATSATTATTATNAQGLTGTPNITVGNVTSANVTNSKQTTSEHVNVTGVGTFGSDISVADNIVHTGNTNTAIKFADNSITLDSAGSLALHIDGSAKIGFGTNNPQKPVDVYGDSTGQLRVSNSSKAADLICDSTGGLLRTIGSYPLVLNTNQTDRLRIGTSGEIGLAVASGVSTDYGTSGQVLTSAGSGSAVSWATPSAGAWTKITSGTIDAVDTIITESLDNTYQLYKLTFYVQLNANGQYFGLRIKTNGSWQTSTYATQFMSGYGDNEISSYAASTDNRMFIPNRGWRVGSGMISFGNVDNTTACKVFRLEFAGNDSLDAPAGNNNAMVTQFSSLHDSITAVTGIRFFKDGSAPDAGWYLLEGCAIS